MIGRKLTERLVVERALNGETDRRLTLVRYRAPARRRASQHVKTRPRPHRAGVAAKAYRNGPM